MPLDVRPNPKLRGLYVPGRYKAAHGGRGSGKSWGIAEAALIRCYNGEFRRCLALREIQRSIASSSLQLLKDTATRLDLTWRGRPFFWWTKDELHGLGGIVWRFKGLRTNLDSIRSEEGVDLAWIAEARSVSAESIRVIRPTLRSEDSELWFDWNPESPDDPVDQMFRGKNGPPPRSWVQEINWSDNRFFPDVLREEMEFDRRNDPVMAEHVWDGAYLQRTDAQVFRNWIVDDFETPEGVRLLAGADFGFGETDPSAGVRCWIDGRRLYIDHEAWGMKVSIDDLPAFFAGSDTYDPPRWGNPRGYPGIPGAMEITWRGDSSRPDLLEMLVSRGLAVSPSIKGAGSVKQGIDWLQSFEIVVHPRCVRTIAELKAYRYKVDRKTEEILPELVDADNHIIDALRYAVEIHRRGNFVY